MADAPKRHGLDGGPALPLDASKGEMPGGFRADDCPSLDPEPEPKAPAKKAEGS